MLMDACDNRKGSWVRLKVERSKNYELWRSLWFELFWLYDCRSFIEWWFMIACWSFGEWQADRRGVHGHVKVNEWLVAAHQVYVLVLIGHEKKSPVVQDHTVYLLQGRTKNRVKNAINENDDFCRNHTSTVRTRDANQAWTHECQGSKGIVMMFFNQAVIRWKTS